MNSRRDLEVPAKASRSNPRDEELLPNAVSETFNTLAGKENTLMKYEKPEIVAVETAIESVQCSTKMGLNFDTKPSTAACTSDE
jgi:hypothetical protein